MVELCGDDSSQSVPSPASRSDLLDADGFVHFPLQKKPIQMEEGEKKKELKGV